MKLIKNKSNIMRSILCIVRFMNKTNAKGGKYAITGSGNLFIRGYNIFPNDIDIICDEASVINLQRSKHNIEFKFIFQRSDDIESNFCETYFSGINLQIMSEVKNKTPSGLWVRNNEWDKNIENFIRCGECIPLLSLAHEMRVCRVRHDARRALRIRRYNDVRKRH